MVECTSKWKEIWQKSNRICESEFYQEKHIQNYKALIGNKYRLHGNGGIQLFLLKSFFTFSIIYRCKQCIIMYSIILDQLIVYFFSFIP